MGQPFAKPRSSYVYYFSGFYCPPGQTQPNPYDYRCTLGHYCLVQTATPSRCANGYFQNELEQSSCKPCTEGIIFVTTAIWQCILHHLTFFGVTIGKKHCFTIWKKILCRNRKNIMSRCENVAKLNSFLPASLSKTLNLWWLQTLNYCFSTFNLLISMI
jgi:hypothetical protein